MPVKSQVLGPGTLKLGEAGAFDVSAQVADMGIEWAESVTAGEVIDLLDGGQLKDEDAVSYAATLVGNLVQDFDTAGVVEYTWTNKGEVVDFEFVPNTALGRPVTGTVRVIPIKLGGAAKKRNRSDISWACPEDPVLGAVPGG